MPRQKRHFEDNVIFEVCYQFMEGKEIREIADWLKKVTGMEKGTRELVYRIVKKGREKGLIRLETPYAFKLEHEVRRRFSNLLDIVVVDTHPKGKNVIDQLTVQCVETVIDLIKHIGSSQDSIQIGIGAGSTTQRFAKKLAQRLQHETHLPKLVLQALTSGFFVKQPNTSPISFFSFFEGLHHLEIEYIGLFAPGWISWDEFEAMKQNHGVIEAFEAANNLDIIVTSLASADDEHGLYNQFLKKYADKNQITQLQDAGWIGDLLWRPFSKQGPIHLRSGIRPVTLLELDELVGFCNQAKKHVVCFAGPCVSCQQTKANALRPLLEIPHRMFNHLIIDRITAETLLASRQQ